MFHRGDVPPSYLDRILSAGQHPEKVEGLYPVLEDGRALWLIFYKYVSRYMATYWETGEEFMKQQQWTVMSARFACNLNSTDPAARNPQMWRVMKLYCPQYGHIPQYGVMMLWTDWFFVVTGMHHLVLQLIHYS